MKKRSIAVNVCRGLLALTFLFSGFVKANDPIGTQIKLNEYLGAMGIETLEGLPTLAAALALAWVEFTLGIYLVIGQRRRIVSLLTVMLMAVMTALTLWIVVADPVSDCGCFGDAIVLSNGMTLAKNVVLLAAAVVVMRWYRLQPPLLHGGWAWLVTTVFPIGILAFAIYCIVSLPLIDFRPYKVGVDLVKDARGEMVDGEWTMSQTAQELSKFYIFDPQLDDDITPDVLEREGYTLLLIAPDLASADQGCAGDINELYDYAQHHDIAFLCLTASNEAAQQRWIDYTGAEYGFCESDKQVLQTMVRANPGLILLKNGVIVRKWSNWQIPTELRNNEMTEFRHNDITKTI